MMKHVMMGTLAAATALVFTGCQMCKDPIAGDPSCIENSHSRGTVIDPGVVEYSKPAFAPTSDVFRPVYKAGTKRVSAVGTGISLEDATADAIAQILTENQCDYLVAVTRIVTKKTHPAGLLHFSTTNYTVTISGLPIFLDKLEREVVKEQKAPVNGTLTADDVKKIIEEFVSKLPQPPPPTEEKCHPFAQIQLTDINLSMTAKAASDKPVAVAVPAPKPAK